MVRTVNMSEIYLMLDRSIGFVGRGELPQAAQTIREIIHGFEIYEGERMAGEKSYVYEREERSRTPWGHDSLSLEIKLTTGHFCEKAGDVLHTWRGSMVEALKQGVPLVLDVTWRLKVQGDGYGPKAGHRGMIDLAEFFGWWPGPMGIELGQYGDASLNYVLFDWNDGWAEVEAALGGDHRVVRTKEGRYVDPAFPTA